jgi:hypothetical protein
VIKVKFKGAKLNINKVIGEYVYLYSICPANLGRITDVKYAYLPVTDAVADDFILTVEMLDKGFSNSRLNPEDYAIRKVNSQNCYLLE